MKELELLLMHTINTIAKTYNYAKPDSHARAK